MQARGAWKNWDEHVSRKIAVTLLFLLLNQILIKEDFMLPAGSSESQAGPSFPRINWIEWRKRATLPETNSSPLKMVGWQTILSGFQPFLRGQTGWLLGSRISLQLGRKVRISSLNQMLQLLEAGFLAGTLEFSIVRCGPNTSGCYPAIHPKKKNSKKNSIRIVHFAHFTSEDCFEVEPLNPH